MNPDLSKLRIKIGDRIRDMSGAEGTVTALQSEVDGLIWWVTATMDLGGEVTELMGHFEKIHRNKLTA